MKKRAAFVSRVSNDWKFEKSFFQRLEILIAVAGLAASGSALAADPAFYQKQATWQETLRVSREALMAQSARTQASNDAAAPTGFAPWFLVKGITDVEQSRRPHWEEKVSLRIAGAKDLFLGIVPMGPRGAGSLRWNDACLVDKSGKKTLLVSLPHSVAKGHENRNAKEIERRQLRQNQTEAHFILDGQYETLEASLYLDLSEGAMVWVAGRSMFAEKEADYNARRQIYSLASRDFPDAESKQMRTAEERDHIWLKDWTLGNFSELAARYASECETKLKEQAAKLSPSAKSVADLANIQHLYAVDVDCREMLKRVERVSGSAMKLAIADLTKDFPEAYPKGSEFLRKAEEHGARLPRIRELLAAGDESVLKEAEAALEFQKAALLANPLLDFGKLLFVRRDGEDNLGLSSNFGPNTNPGGGSEIDVLSPVKPDGQTNTLFRDKNNRGLCDVQLDFDAEKMLFTMTDSKGNPQIWEIQADGSGLRQITPSEESDQPNRDGTAVQNCNGNYLPDGRIVFVSTATMTGVPCVGGGLPVGNLYRCDADGKNIQQLTFDQDQNWYPTMLQDGRVLYTRWEYTDTAHYFTRLLFTMNPDGTEQKELYGSNSYWPNSMFFTRPIPGDPSKLVTVVTGHHGSQRAGELVVLDSAKAHKETGGVIQRIPGYGQKVEPTIRDALVDESWPKFLYPYPLSEKYFLVSCKLTPDAPWGIYIADVFDNLVPLRVEPGRALMEATPFRKTPRPRIIVDRVKPDRKDALVYMQDVYSGGGMAGIPRGTVKKLRVISYAYNYRYMGSHSLVGQESGWDVKRILGTVPVTPEGSALFRVPANTPIAVQPLDDDGRALQIMRSWMTARPGETLSCVGCHEMGNSSPQPSRAAGSGQSIAEITPFYGPARGYSFDRDVQPVLDRYCNACHNGQPRDGKTIPDFANRELSEDTRSAGFFSKAYLALNSYVRRPGPESDYHLFFPMEWHAETSELVQLLKKGHYNVKLDTEAWDRLYTWIDLNVPFYGTYRETKGHANEWNPRSALAAARRIELQKLFAHVDVDPEAIPELPKYDATPVLPPPDKLKSQISNLKLSDWPFDEKQARKMQGDAGKESKLTIPLGDNLSLTMIRIPAGEFVMGDPSGYDDELPLSVVKIEKPFWMAEVETSNKQFAQFDPTHDSGYQDMPGKDLSARGYAANQPDQPVVRVTWQQAMDYCKWLSARTGRNVTLPTEAQWEWTCRCGTEKTPQNLVGRINNKWGAAGNVGSSSANAWGVKDLYGNVSEWTRTAYQSYPYRTDDGRNEIAPAAARVARGASWFDSPNRARAGMRIAYQPYQHVFNVGLRVIVED